MATQPAAPTRGEPYTAHRAGALVHLQDTARQMVVSVVTSVGNIAYEMKVRGQHVLRFPFASVKEFIAKPTGLHGIPLLAPWANRLDGAAFYANSRRYALDLQLGNVSGPYAIHGFLARTNQWQVLEVIADAGSAWVTSHLDVGAQPDWMRQWPFAHRIEMTYRLREGVLEVSTRVTNRAADPMPVALGYHPYFKLTDSPRAEWTVKVPARTRWLLADTKLPTGETEPAERLLPNQTGRLKDMVLDDVFADLARDAQGRATVSVKGRSQQLDIVLGANYRALVLYAPAGQEFICVEPMAGITDAMNLAHRGVYKDLQYVQPGATWQESFWIRPTGF